MDMQINKEFLRQQREQRCWTQSHLAEVADLSLRTVQRIETSGISSNESAMAIAAALEIQLTDLRVQNSVEASNFSSQGHRWKFVILFLATLATGVGWWSTASAEPLLIGLSVKSELGSQSDMQFANETGVPSEIKFDQEFRLLVTATRKGDQLLLSTEVYDYVDGAYQLLSKPAILIADNQSATIGLDTTATGHLEFSFKSDF